MSTDTSSMTQAAALIPLAGMYPLMTDAQREGRACPGATRRSPLHPASTSASGPTRSRRVIHPVACRPCTNRQARDAWFHHRRTCLTCHKDGYCEPSRMLRRLALETRR
ncbi:hypothetical protein DN402_31870 [Streptomyces sp. SW4]|nr:hypothetical protein DN402_31870 [Streptomyces sp. SW4]